MKKYFQIRPFFHKMPEPVSRLLVDRLYAEDSRLLFGAILLVLAAALAFARSGSLWFLVWGAVSLPIAFGRLAVGRSYRHEPDRATSRQWTLLAMAGAWSTGALWGFASVALVVQHDAFVQFLLIVCQTAFVAGGAVRNSSVPFVAKGQTLLASVPLVLASIASGNIFYQLFAIFAVFHILATWTIIHTVHEQTLTILLDTREKSRLIEELHQVNSQLESLASTDALTQIHNRRGLDIRLAQEWRRSIRSQTPLSILLLDVDCFKAFNDLYGHQTGDDCLFRVAQGILKGTSRPADIVARYGGEEFAVVLPFASSLISNIAIALSPHTQARSADSGATMKKGLGASLTTNRHPGLVQPARLTIHGAEHHRQNGAFRQCLRSRIPNDRPSRRRQIGLACLGSGTTAIGKPENASAICTLQGARQQKP